MTPSEEELWEAEEPKARILRSKSLCHDEIENILDSDHRELIGDYSKVPAVGPSGGLVPCGP